MPLPPSAERSSDGVSWGRAALQRTGFPFIGSTSYAPESYGARLIDLALKLLRGEPVPPAVYIEHTFVSA